MSLRNLRKLLVLSALLILILAAAFGAACVDGSDPADQDFDNSDEIGLPDDDNGLEPAAVNPNAPAAPTNLAALVMSYNRIDLAWDNNSYNEAGFKVYRKKVGSALWILIARLAPDNFTYQSIGLKPGNTYSYKIVAYNSYGKTKSNIASDTIPILGHAFAPVGLSAHQFSSSQIDLSWADRFDNEYGFKIERKTGAKGAWTQVGAVGANVVNYSDLSLVDSTTYYYRVLAYNSLGNSSYSNNASATTLAPQPPNMALIPYGCFNMGDANDAYGGGGFDELPVHYVCITSSFYMDVHEVTNAEYAMCVSSGICNAPDFSHSNTRDPYYGNPTYNNFPMIWVLWYMAKDYCDWAGKRLPTEAEWEYAARGGLSGKRYPWGDTISGTEANYWNSGDPWDNDTSPVEYYGANGYGLYDMSGNVWEWVNDWYEGGYYTRPNPDIDPPGPASGTYRVTRGGSYWYIEPPWPLSPLRVAARGYLPPSTATIRNGFRCAGD